MIRRRWPRTSLPDGVWPQNDRDGAPRCGIVDMNRQEAAIIIMRVEQRELLMTMRDIASIVDIECDGLRGRGVTGAINIDEDAAQPQNFAQSRCILPTRHGGLRAQVIPRIGQAPTSELEGGVLAQMIEIVRIFITAGDGENARAQDTAERMGIKTG